MRFTSRQTSFCSSVVTEIVTAARSMAWLLMFAVLIAQPSPAQDYLSQAGSPAFSVAQRVNFGFVNLANGNLHTEINLAEAPQRGGLAFSAKLIYDSRIWQAVKVGGSLVWKPTNIPNSLGGWRFVTSADTGTVTFDTSTTSCDGGTSFTFTFSNFVWQSPDGTKRVFPLSTAQSQGCGIDVSSADAFASDASGYHMYVTNYQVAAIYAKDGTKVFPVVQDTNGNHFSTDVNGNVVDTLGRTVITKTVSGSQTFFDVLNSQGTTSRITMTTRSILVSTGFSGSQTGITDDHENITVINSVTLPSGDAYSFSYDESVLSSPGLFTVGYGLLKSISLSGGVGEEYTYTNFVDSFGVVNRWATSGGDGTITYVSFSSPACHATGPTFCDQGATVSRNGGKASYVFSINGGAWNTKADFQATRSFAEILTDYDFTQTCPVCQGAAYVRPNKIRQVMPTGVTSETDFGYDSPQSANVTSIKDWNYYTSNTTPPVAPNHQTIIAYSTDPALLAKNMINRVISATGQDGAGNQKSQTKFEYDTIAPTPLSTPIVNLDTTIDTHRGNLTRISRWIGGTSFLDTFVTYDASGQILQVKDPAGNITKLNYADRFSNDNGVNPPPATTPAQPTNAYLTSITSPTNEVTQFGYYFATGKQAFVIDPNGQPMYEHFMDALDRLTQIVAPRGWKAVTYDSILDAQTFSGTTDQQPSTSCTGCIHTAVSFDSRGHLSAATVLSDPDGPVTRAFINDFAGNVLQATNPIRSAKTFDFTKATSNSYDVLYRPIQTAHPDGSVAKIFYGEQVAGVGGSSTQLCPVTTYGLGFQILTVDEAGKKQQLWRDAFGRVIEADEQDPSGAWTQSTCYQYNVGGELTQVVQGDLARSYLYDSLWRVTQVTTPEAGVESYNYLNDDGTFCSGDPSSVCKRTDARGITTRYRYDSSGRVVSKTYSDGTPAAVFNYGEASALGLTLTNTVGRVSSVYTVDAAGNKITGEVFSYDTVGNIINNSQCTPQNCGAGVFQNTYSTDLVGNITNFSNSWGRSVSTTYDNAGQATSVTVNPADATHPATILSNAKYNEFGSMISATLGNGLDEALGYSSKSGVLNSVRVGVTDAFNQVLPGNIATPGKTTITISGAVKQVSTAASPGTASLTISGSPRQVANGLQAATPSTGSVTISGTEQQTQTVEAIAQPGVGSVSISGVVQSKQAILQSATTATGSVAISGTQQSKVVVQPAVAGTDNLTLTGTLQSKQVTQPAAPGSGSFTISGALQAKATTAATGATGSVTFSGNEQSKAGTPAKSGSANLSISGFEGSIDIDPCADQGVEPTFGGGGGSSSCPRTVWDTGSVSATVNGFKKSAPYGQGSTASTVATALAGAFNTDSASPVTAVASGTGVTLTSKAAGAATNYSFSTASSTGDATDFGGPSFTVSPVGGALANGADAGSQTLDSGTCSVTINGTPYSTGFGQGDNTNTIASRLASTISGGTLANGTATGGTISFNTKQTGTASNYSLASACSFNSSGFTSASFTTSASGAAFTGGSNAIPAVTDSGTVSLKIGPTFTASACYGPNGSCSAVTGCPTGDSTSLLLACVLASPNNPNGLNRAGSPVSASVTTGSATINIQSAASGAGTNYSLASSSTFNTANFPAPSFSGNPSGVTLTGGKDAATNTVFDAGATSVNIGGHTTAYPWSGSATTATSIASGLASAINADTAALVKATVISPGNIKLTARSTGASTNYAAQTSTSFDSADFSSSSFSSGLSTATLTNGADAVSSTIYDSGTATITVNGHPDSAPWSGQGATAAGLAASLVAAINGDSAAPVTGSVAPGSTTISLKTKQSGVISNFALASSSTFDTADFSSAAFTAGRSGATLTGGTDAVTAPTYDSGTVKVSVGTLTATAPFGQIWTDQDLTAITGTANTLAVAAISGFAWPDASSPNRVFYEDALKGHVHRMVSIADGWQDKDITTSSGEASVPAPNTPLVSIAWPNSSSPENVFYSYGFQHIVELWLDTNGIWHSQDITALAGAPATSTTNLTGFLSTDPSAPLHLFYSDNSRHIHELWSDSNGAWHDQDITAAAAAPQAFFKGTSFWWPNSSSPKHVFYWTGSTSVGNIHELWSDASGAWHDRDLTALSGAPAGGVPASSFVWPNSSSPEHVFYATPDSHVHEIWSDSSGGWHHQDITTLSGAPVSDGNSIIQGILTTDTAAPEHVFYLDASLHIQELSADSAGWHHRDVTALSAADRGGFLVGLADSNGTRLLYTTYGPVLTQSPGRIHDANFGVTSSSQVSSILVNDAHSGLNLPSSPVIATVSGTTINLTSKTSGLKTNYNLSTASTFDSSNFAAPSITGTPSGSGLSGGADALWTPLYDFGTFSVTINNHTDTVDWGAGSSSGSLASSLATALNLDSGAAVTAAVSGNVITFTSKASGANTNYTYATQINGDLADFPNKLSFTFQPNVLPLPTLQGGHDANGTVWDSGTLKVTVNGFLKTVPYSQTDSISTLAVAIANAFNADQNSPVWACQCNPSGNPGQVTFTARKAGSSTNYTISAASATNNSNFTSTAFPVSLSNPTLVGGVDAGATHTASDSGIVSLTVGSFQASVEYGQNTNATPAPACCTASDIAIALANQINQSGNAPVVAGAAGAQILLTAKAGGATTNYAFSTSSQSNDTVRFPTPSFSFSSSSGSLSGGANKSNSAAGSSSIAAIAINGGGSFPAITGTCDYSIVLALGGTFGGQACVDNPFSPAATAANLAQDINTRASLQGGLMTATVSGTTLLLQSVAGGLNMNYPISWDLADKIGNNADSLLPTLPVRVGLSGSTMSGGTDNGGLVYALDLGTDPAGTVFGANDSVNGNWNYFYDNLNRLQEASTPALGYKYDYDRYGNRLQQTPLNGGNPLSAVYLNNRLVATGVVYDASGNMIQDGNHTYSYDAENRLVSVDNGATATYTYTADGLRVRSSVGALVFDYVHDLDGGTVGVLGPGGTLIRQEIGGIATYSDAAYFHHRDWLGNLRAVTDQTGAIRKTCTNLPFGDALSCTTAGITPTDFTGYMRDTETNLDFANARYYTSQFGRFMSPDPLGGNISDPQSINSYSYVLNNALSAIDPSGMDPVNLPIACGPGTGHPCGGTGGNDSGGGSFGGPFGGGSTGGGGPGIGICLYPCLGSLGGGPAVPGAPTAAQLANESNVVSAPGFLESLIPVWGSAKAAIHDFQTGHYGWGIFNTALAISDVFLVKSAVTAIGKIAIRGLAEVGARQAIGSTGKVGEAALKELVGGIPKKFFPTSQGARYVDQFAGTVAHEAKTGYTSLTRFVRSQIAKDAELISTKQVSGVVWHFYTSPLTGVGGASRPLFRELIQNGISIAFH